MSWYLVLIILQKYCMLIFIKIKLDTFFYLSNIDRLQ